MYPKSIQKLINLFTQFPTVGPRTAARFVFYLHKAPEKTIQELVEAILELKKGVAHCNFCFNPFQKSEEVEKSSKQTLLCPICQNPKRNSQILCVVEKETDLEALEKTKKYNGLYFILGGTVGKLRKKDLEPLRIKELIARIKKPSQYGIASDGFKEIILAMNATTEGEATALYLQRQLSPLGIKISRLGRGLPAGGELEYADEETIAGALDNRK